MMPLVLPHGVDSPGAAEAAQQLPLVAAAQLPARAARLPVRGPAAQLPLLVAAQLPARAAQLPVAQESEAPLSSAL